MFGQGESAGVGSWDNMTNRAGTTKSHVCWKLESGEGLRMDCLLEAFMVFWQVRSVVGGSVCPVEMSFSCILFFFCILLLPLRNLFVS